MRDILRVIANIFGYKTHFRCVHLIGYILNIQKIVIGHRASLKFLLKTHKILKFWAYIVMKECNAQRFRVEYFLAEKALNILKFVGKSVIFLVYKSIVHGLKKQEDFTKTKMLGGNDNV